MLSRAEKKARKQGLSNICFAVRDLTALPEGNGSFDVVIAANVLHLLPEPETAVRELWRVTAPGGRLILPTYLQGKAEAAYGTPGTYRTFLENLCLAPVELEVIPGHVPEGIALLEKLY